MLKATFSGIEPEKCAQRNRIAAKRDGVDAAPVSLLQSAPAETQDPKVITARGKLPKDDAEAVEVINSRRPGAEPLTADQLHIHYLEAASSRYIGDRYMFLDAKTLRNIADGARDGFAFMNSHRTGDVSTPSELPFGRTFAGRYEHFIDTDGQQRQRSLLGVYMLRDIKPNGENGPSTDDLSAAIKAGTVFDVSMGLYGGTRVCDVCGNELNARDPETREYLCPHAPGTHRHMDSAARETQKAKGVPGGHATYSLVDATPGEVSAVYDGAVPGAGFRKAIGLSRENRLSKSDVLEARAAYSALLSKGDLPEVAHRHQGTKKMNLKELFSFWKAAGQPDEIDLDAFSGNQPTLPPPASEDDVRSKLAKAEQRATLAEQDAIDTRADAFVAEVVGAANQTLFAKDLRSTFVLLARDDNEHPVGNSRTHRQDAFRATMRNRPAATKEYASSDPAEETRALASDPASEAKVAANDKATAELDATARNVATQLNGKK